MSQWTHVSGCIRIDEIPEYETHTIVNKIQRKFRNPPTGSEGPINFSIVRTGDHGSIAWGLVYLWGDLRDFSDEDVPSILDWVKGACDGLINRSCIVGINVGYGISYVIQGMGDGSIVIRPVSKVGG